jgi:endonuclease/exonuclease/phosphatase family metal-dependent hydrolase
LTEVTIGTYNLNNLFSRFNFNATIKKIQLTDVKFEFKDGDTFKIKVYNKKLVEPKSEDDTKVIAQKIKNMKVDVLAVQEVEDIETLKMFNSEYLNDIYEYQVLVEGNDKRFIDLGLLSKLPLRAITSWQKTVHDDFPSYPVFGRDLLEVEVMDEDRENVLFVVFNNHLKSAYVPFGLQGEEREREEERCKERRQRQAEMIEKIVESEASLNDRYVILGDMNDSPDSQYLAPFIDELDVVNALEHAQEVRSLPPKETGYVCKLPDNKVWTHRFLPTGEEANYDLLDHIWLSSALADHHNQADEWIDHRVRSIRGDGSDHDPAYIKLTNL